MNEELKRKLLKLSEDGGICINEEGLELKTTFRPPLSSEDRGNETADWIAKIPRSYNDILEIANGFTLFNYEDLDGYRFLGIDELGKENDFIEGIYVEDWDERILIFCIVLGDGDYFAFRQEEGGRYSILDCYHDEIPANWKVIGTSIDDFLSRLIDEKGRKFYVE